MYIICIQWIMLVFLVMYIIRADQGPSIWDRLHGLSMVSTKIFMLIVLLASFHDTAYLLDIAIVYALLGFIGTIFTSLFLQDRLKRGTN